jgi:hypothetical protein
MWSMRERFLAGLPTGECRGLHWTLSEVITKGEARQTEPGFDYLVAN